MLAKRIIPCLDVKDGQTVKGVNFVNFREAGDPVALGKKYSDDGADELVYLDITASHEGRKTFIDLVRRVAENVSIPFTVGGGINQVEDLYFNHSAALRNPDLIDGIARRFGNQVCVTAIDARLEGNEWVCYINGGRVSTGRKLIEWAHEAQERGAGEILFTSMDHDGVKTGFANDALAMLHDRLSIPIIASGGAGDYPHFYDVFTQGKADAALAASIFHFNEIPINELKEYLCKRNINIRL